MTTATTSTPEQEARRRRHGRMGRRARLRRALFDGYDLVVYGTVLSTFLRDPTQIGPVTPCVGRGAGQLRAGRRAGRGAAGGHHVRRPGPAQAHAPVLRVVLGRMAITALMTTTTGFGILRFVTGLGVGSLVATTGAIVSEFAPPGKKNLCNAIVYCGVPFGSLLSALLAIILLAGIGWRGMFWIGALPIITLLPLAFFKMPESPTWLLARGRIEEARALSEQTGVPLEEAAAMAAPAGGETRADGLRRPVHREQRAAGDPDGVHERHRPRAGVRAQHLAARADDPRGVLDARARSRSCWCSTAAP